MASPLAGAEQARAVRELNDAFRKGERPELGSVFITDGVRELLAAWPLGPVVVYDIVRKFDAFESANDPYGEHDFGSFEHVGEKAFLEDRLLRQVARGRVGESGRSRGDDARAHHHARERVLSFGPSSEGSFLLYWEAVRLAGSPIPIVELLQANPSS